MLGNHEARSIPRNRDGAIATNPGPAKAIEKR